MATRCIFVSLQDDRHEKNKFLSHSHLRYTSEKTEENFVSKIWLSDIFLSTSRQCSKETVGTSQTIIYSNTHNSFGLVPLFYDHMLPLHKSVRLPEFTVKGPH